MSSAGTRGFLVAATAFLVGTFAVGCANPASSAGDSSAIASVDQVDLSASVSVDPGMSDSPVASLVVPGAPTAGQPEPAPRSVGVDSSAVNSSAATGGGPGTAPGTGSAGGPSQLTPVGSTPPRPPSPVRPAVPSSPLLFPQADGTLTANSASEGAVTLNPSDGKTRDGEPYRPMTFTAQNLWLVPTDGATAFDLAIDAGKSVGSGTQVRVSYDLTGNGSWERVETYQYFATDPVPGMERYTQDAGLLDAQGSLGDMTGGVVQLEVWSALGEGGTTLDLTDSSLTLPYS